MSELKAVAALTQILGIVQNYLPPDSGMTADDALGQIIAVVDPWPLDGEPQLPAIPAGWEGSWRWMQHPTWNHGEPIPVQVWKEASTGVVYYRPFDCRAQDFEWELRNSDWEEIAPAPQPSAVDGATLAGLIASEGHLSQLVDQMRALLVEVEDVCGHDDRGFEFEDGESEIIDKVRAMIAVTSEPQQTAPERHPVGKEQVPVAVIGNDWTLLFTDGGPIDQIAKKHGLKIGSLLYTQPSAVEPVPAPEQKPVAWRYLMPYAGRIGYYLVQDVETANSAAEQGFKVEPLYTAPKPQDGRLYAAINNLLAYCGAKGSIDAGHPFVTETMDALSDIDGGVYSCSMATASSTDRVICKDEQISTAFNAWFESLPNRRKAILMDDKWMLARAAFKAAHGITAKPQAQQAKAAEGGAA